MLELLINISIKTGWVIVPLFLCGLVGWIILIQLYFFLRDQKIDKNVIKKKKFLQAIEADDVKYIEEHLANEESSVLSGYLKMLAENHRSPKRHLDNLCRAYTDKNLSIHFRGISTIKAMAAVAPLLGLLGTVSGMIVTFDVISFYGNSNPVLMADGISEALLTTQAGLTIAFPLLFFQVLLNGKLKNLKNTMEDYLIEIEHRKILRHEK